VGLDELRAENAALRKHNNYLTTSLQLSEKNYKHEQRKLYELVKHVIDNYAPQLRYADDH
jgi:hypothetical protein